MFPPTTAVTMLPRAPFQLASPPGFHVTHIPKGNLICMKWTFLRNTKLFSCGRGSFLALSAAGHTCGSRPGSVERALGVQSNEIWQAIAGLLSGQLAPTRPMQTPKTLYFFSFTFSPLLLFLESHTNRQRLGSQGTTVALAAFPLVTVTNGASACGFVSVCHCRILQQPGPGTQVSRTSGAIQLGIALFHFVMLSAAAAVCLYYTVSV